MKRLGKVLAVLVGSVAATIVAATDALAQTPINPSITPEKNVSPTGPLGPLPNIAQLILVLGLLVVVVIVIGYMRYAPRFAAEEGAEKAVIADRVRLGQELPHRNVDLSQASPVVVAPPAIPVPAAAPAAAPPAAAPAPAAAAPAPAAAAPAPAAAAPAPAAAAPAPAAAAPAPAAAAPAPAAAAPAPAAAAPAPATAAPAAPAPAPAAPRAPAAAPTERVEVSIDQAVYDKTLEELLAAGTDRRIAEGKAKRAGMVAAKRAAGEG